MTDEARTNASLERILRGLGHPDLVARLGSGLPPSDLTTLLMAVAAQRAVKVDGPHLLRRYEEDRFTRPGRAGFLRLRQVEDAFVRAVPDDWDWVTLAPLVPLGTHAVLGDLSQDRVVSTIRSVEVAADPTDGLALEAASRRRDTTMRRSDAPQRLASIQRLTRAQRFDDDDAFAHFDLFASVTAGRSGPNDSFDAPALLEHLRIYVDALARASAEQVRIVLSGSGDRWGTSLVDTVRTEFADADRVSVLDDPDRLAAQRYYRRACFKVHATICGSTFEVADGGFTDWMERLLADRHERLLISGAGLDRIALALERFDASMGRP